MPAQWTPELEKTLLLHTLDQTLVPNYVELAAKMGLTDRAVR